MPKLLTNQRGPSRAPARALTRPTIYKIIFHQVAVDGSVKAFFVHAEAEHPGDALGMARKEYPCAWGFSLHGAAPAAELPATQREARHRGLAMALGG